MSVKIVESEPTTVITKKCINISKKFIKAMQKYGIAFELVEQVTSEPQNDYELIYGQRTLKEGSTYKIHGLITVNPSEKVYKDMHLNAHGDAIIEFMTYSLQEVNFIGNTLLDYQTIPDKILGYHVKAGNDEYRIDECKAINGVFQGFPLHMVLSLSYIDKPLYEDDKGLESGD